jgi:hypothetical protein
MTIAGLSLLAFGGCASDYKSSALDDPSENLPLSRPPPISTYGLYGDQLPAVVTYPKGTDYPEN